MNIREGSVYSNGKNRIFRKVLKIVDNRVIFAKCYYRRGEIYVIGGGVTLLESVYVSTLRRWAKYEMPLRDSAIETTE